MSKGKLWSSLQNKSYLTLSSLPGVQRSAVEISFGPNFDPQNLPFWRSITSSRTGLDHDSERAGGGSVLDGGSRLKALLCDFEGFVGWTARWTVVFSLCLWRVLFCQYCWFVSLVASTTFFQWILKRAQHITLHIASFSLLQLLQFWSCPPILFLKIAFSVPHDTYFLIMGLSSFMYKNAKWCYIPNHIQGQFTLKMQFAKCWHDNCIESSLLGLFLQTGLLCMAIWRLSNLKPNYIQMNAPRRPVVQQQ